MSKVADSIRRGLKEAVAYAEGKADKRAYRIRVPKTINVKAIRTRLDMTQEEFAGRFGFSVNTLRHWEQGSRQPEGPTRAYLLVIERAPKAVQKALQAACAHELAGCARARDRVGRASVGRRRQSTIGPSWPGGLPDPWTPQLDPGATPGHPPSGR